MMITMGRKRCDRRRGFTLTELAIVLGIIGVIASAVWYAGSNASELQKENNAVSELQNVALNINNIMAGQQFTQAGDTDVTSDMIKKYSAIPTSWANAKTGTTADNPWNVGSVASSTGFVVWANPSNANTRQYRLSFYNTTYKGCMALLLQGTSCQFGQVGCPTEVYTNLPNGPTVNGNDFCQPGPPFPNGNCYGAASSAPGWQSMTVTVASEMCGDNATNGGSVEFDFSL